MRRISYPTRLKIFIFLSLNFLVLLLIEDIEGIHELLTHFRVYKSYPLKNNLVLEICKKGTQKDWFVFRLVVYSWFINPESHCLFLVNSG
jgi:hypothetical protein